MPGTIGAISRILPTITRGKHITTSAAIAIPTFTLRVEEQVAVAIRLNHAVAGDAAAADMVATIVKPTHPFPHRYVLAREIDLRR
jgi:ribosomal protein L5